MAIEKIVPLVNEEFEPVREKLLQSIFAARKSDNFRKKSMVKALYPEIVSAKDTGLDFEQIAEVIKGAGVEIAPSTLRQYFYEIKRDRDLSALASKTSAQVSGLFKKTQQKALADTSRNSVLRAKEYASEAMSRPALATSPAIIARAGRDANIEALVGDPQVAKNATAGAAAPAVAPTAKPSAAQPQAAPNKWSPRENQTPANSLASIEIRSKIASEFPTLETDLELRKDGCVYEAPSGAPYEGVLSARQILMLQRTKTLVGAPQGRTSGDFVKMNKKL
ncbi:hypothetical protein ACIPLR_17630 [Herbaspirillum huttiense]|uniref:hypothetical protein n=1 Tax=Herbaspirillum huttiense TaxID=863372 RepID=UPI00380C5698